MRNPTDLRDPASFDHVGRDKDATSLVAGDVLADIADKDDRIVAAAADLKYVTHFGQFAQRHPERFFQFGISERNMITAAAGMATTGLIPYVCTFACFSAILAYENIRTDLAYPNLPVRVLGTHTGISMGFFGTSHHATEDIAALRAIAGLTILSPADAASTDALLRATIDHPGPIYFRLGRGRDSTVYPEGVPDGMTDRSMTELRSGRDLLIIATGVMVREAVDAAGVLESEGVSSTVLDIHSLKPFDDESISSRAADHSAVLVVEEHNVEGGLGTMVREAVASNGVRTPVYKHGLYDEFGIVGPPTHLYRYYGLDSSGIARVGGLLLRQTSEDAGDPVRLWTEADKQRVLADCRSGT